NSTLTPRLFASIGARGNRAAESWDVHSVMGEDLAGRGLERGGRAEAIHSRAQHSQFRLRELVLPAEDVEVRRAPDLEARALGVEIERGGRLRLGDRIDAAARRADEPDFAHHGCTNLRARVLLLEASLPELRARGLELAARGATLERFVERDRGDDIVRAK